VVRCVPLTTIAFVLFFGRIACGGVDENDSSINRHVDMS